MRALWVDLSANAAYNISVIMHIILLKELNAMPTIRPVSDLRNHFAEITREVQESQEPVFLTKNGVGSIVVMSMESYEQRRYDSMVYDKLREAEIQAAGTAERLSHGEVMAKARERIKSAEEAGRV